MPRLFERLKSLAPPVSRRPRSRFRSSPLRGTSPLPAAITLESWETEELPTESVPEVSEPEEQEPEPAFGEIRPGATDLRRYIGPHWKG